MNGVGGASFGSSTGTGPEGLSALGRGLPCGASCIVEGMIISPLLMPAAHCLLQCREEVRGILRGLTVEQVWSRPANVAAVGYHIGHAIGSLDRLFTYARGESLSDKQREDLAREARMQQRLMTAEELTIAFDSAVDRARPVSPTGVSGR